MGTGLGSAAVSRLTAYFETIGSHLPRREQLESFATYFFDRAGQQAMLVRVSIDGAHVSSPLAVGAGNAALVAASPAAAGNPDPIVLLSRPDRAAIRERVIGYVPKVKNLLTGLAATDDEVQAVVNDPNALRGLIDQWMTLPSFKLRMLDFFRNAFQQNQVDTGLLQMSLNQNIQINEQFTSTLSRNLMDSFALTVWELVKQGKPFTQALTTNSYMLTTAMMSTMSFFDDMHVSDTRQGLNRLGQRAAIAQYTFDTASTATLAESLDPTNPKYMVFHMAAPQPAGCATTAVTFKPANANDGNYYNRLFSFFMGKTQFDPCPTAGVNNPPSSAMRSSSRMRTTPTGAWSRSTPTRQRPARRRRSTMSSRCAARPTSRCTRRASVSSGRSRSIRTGPRTRRTKPA